MHSSILIVKTSSLGDIVQTFHVLDFLHQIFPNAAIDWVVEKKFASIISAHPRVRRAIPIDRDQIFASLKSLRSARYDFLFDLQGNSKSGGLTFFSRARVKVGFGWASVREWPNLFSTHFRFNSSENINIRLQYLSIIAQFFQAPIPSQTKGVLLNTSPQEKKRLKDLIQKKSCQIMVCPGSHWINKQLPLEVFLPFLSLIQKKYNAFFLLIWGTEKEKTFCEHIQEAFPQQGMIIDKLSLSSWQNLMSFIDLLIALDSSALHLCATTDTPSFSVFGPTSAEIFKPLGNHHFAFQGKCPYGRLFQKRCPILRTCPTGACIRTLDPNELFSSFSQWWDGLCSRLYTE
jgi:heptosyltransferase-1